MYQALYRKYRPRSFSDVTGQEHVTETLRRQIAGDRMTHAYLFVGTRGTGKTTCAKILSRAVNCTSPVDGDPCNKCASCTGIESGSILDVLELDAASNNGVDNVRALREEAIYTPASVKKRVYIIDEVHMLSTAAFNALLKILEEPPGHLLFILATTELHKVPATILSRCQRFSFKRLSPATISARLDAIASMEGLTLAGDASAKLAALADGSMRDGISLLDQCASDTVIDLQRVHDMIGLTGRQELLQLAASVASRDTPAALGNLERLYNDGRDMASLLNELASLVRDLLVARLSPESPLIGGSYSYSELSTLSSVFTPERLFFSLEVLREAVIGLSRNGSARLSVELCLIRLCDERLTDDAPALLARVARLEGGVIRDAVMPVSHDASIAATVTPTVAAMSPTPPAPAGPVAPATPPAPPAPPEPTASTAPSTNATEPPGNDFWPEILRHLESNIPVHALLSDGEKIRAELQENSLVLYTVDKFIVSSIESKMISDPLREAARKTLARDVVLRVEIATSGGHERKSDKLESLKKFDIVKYE